MIRFDSDYLEGAHPKIMERLMSTNLCQTVGYGEDEFCNSAREKIKKAICCDGADVHFLVGGTQSNLTVIASALRAHQGVVAVDTGHIAVHETGAIEACGHKILAVKNENGKLNPEEIEKIMNFHSFDPSFEHTVQPKMVYISQTTETGSLYTLEEVEAISKVCKKHKLYLFLDGARLGYALAVNGDSLSMSKIAELVDVFYIGGTKVGALFGEAVVIINDELKTDFRYVQKQKGGMLAKGRLLGIQFDTLFSDNLYVDIAKNAIDRVVQLKNFFEQKGIEFFHKPETNQLFPILPLKVVNGLKSHFSFSIIEPFGKDKMVVRFCTSWATPKENIDKLIKKIDEVL